MKPQVSQHSGNLHKHWHCPAILTLWQRQTPRVRAERDPPRLETFLSPGHAGKISQSLHEKNIKRKSCQQTWVKRVFICMLYCWSDWPSADESAGSCSERSGSYRSPCDGYWPWRHLSSPAASWLPIDIIWLLLLLWMNKEVRSTSISEAGSAIGIPNNSSNPI